MNIWQNHGFTFIGRHYLPSAFLYSSSVADTLATMGDVHAITFINLPLSLFQYLCDPTKFSLNCR